MVVVFVIVYNYPTPFRPLNHFPREKMGLILVGRDVLNREMWLEVRFLPDNANATEENENHVLIVTGAYLDHTALHRNLRVTGVECTIEGNGEK